MVSVLRMRVGIQNRLKRLLIECGILASSC
jgi:hypothetical protein